MIDRAPADHEFLKDAAATAAEVTSGPPCGRCGMAMEPGLVQVRSATSRVELLWTDPGPRAGAPGPPVEVLPWGPGGRYHAIRGFRCPECKRLELGYGFTDSEPLPEAKAESPG